MTFGIFASMSAKNFSIAVCTWGRLDATGSVVVEDDLRLHLAVAEARLREEVERGLALGAGQAELGLERTADRARQSEASDEEHDPDDRARSGAAGT